MEVGCGRIAWDRGVLVKKRIDAFKHAGLYFGRAIPWELLLVGEQGTAHLDADHSLENPKAVYPTWAYGEDAGLLEELCKSNVGDQSEHCNDMRVAVDERPVLGQQHRVVVIDIPNVTTGPGRQFVKWLRDLQEDYPECIIHVHGLYSYQIAFGFGFRAADMEARSAAAKGKVVVPAGKEMKWEAVAKNPQWVTVLGFKPVELGIPRVRCMYNIKSALWAGENYVKLDKFKVQGQHTPNTTAPAISNSQPQTVSIMSKKQAEKAGDKFTCDTCSLQLNCKYFRTGAVCSVPGAEPTELANYFKTRDSELILDGLGTLMAAGTRRLQQGMEEEQEFGDLSPEVTKMLNQLFQQGVKLAQLVNPDLRGGAKVQVNVNGGGNTQVNMATPQQLMGQAVRELEARGIRREDITPAMIEGLLTGMANPQSAQRAVEAKVIQHGEA